MIEWEKVILLINDKKGKNKLSYSLLRIKTEKIRLLRIKGKIPK